MINVQVWKDALNTPQLELPLEFIKIYDINKNIFKSDAIENFNLFMEIAPQCELKNSTMFVQEWFIFAIQNKNLIAINCNVESKDYTNILYVIDDQREAMVNTFNWCTLKELFIIL